MAQDAKETAPDISRVLAIHNPDNLAWPGWLRAASPVAASIGVTLTPGEVRDRKDIKRMISAHAQGPNGGMIVLPDTITSLNRKLIIALLERLKVVPSVKVMPTLPLAPVWTTSPL